MQTTISSFILNIVFKKEQFPLFKSQLLLSEKGIRLGDGQLIMRITGHWDMRFTVLRVQKRICPGMTIFAYMRYDEVQPWASSFNTVSSKQNRGADYESFKNKKTEQLAKQGGRTISRFKKIHSAYLYIHAAHFS